MAGVPDAVGGGHRRGAGRPVSVPMPRVLGYADPLSVGAGGDDPLHGRHARRAPPLSRGGGAPRLRRHGSRRPRTKTVRLPTPIEGEHEGRPSSSTPAPTHRRAPGGLRRAHPLHPPGLHPAHPGAHPARAAPAGHHGDLGRGPRRRLRAPARRDRRARPPRRQRARGQPGLDAARRSPLAAVVSRGGLGRPRGGDGVAAPDAAGRPHAEPRAAGGGDGAGPRDAAARRATSSSAPPAAASRAAGCARPAGTSMARSIARRLVAAAPSTPDELAAAATARSHGAAPPRTRIGMWDLAADMATEQVSDRSPRPAPRPDGERAQARRHRPQLGRHRDGLAPGARTSTAPSTFTTTTSTTPAGPPA